MPRSTAAFLFALLCVLAAPARAITLDQAMADPDWIGAPVEAPYWSVDGKSIYYSLKRKGSSVRDLHRVDPASSTDVVVEPAAMASADGPRSVFDGARRRAAFVRNGDVFLRETGSGRLTQVTRTTEKETSPQFSADGRAVQFRTGNDWFSHDIASGVTGPAAILRAEKDPEDKKPDDLGELQLRLFSTLRSIRDDREATKANEESFRKGDPTRTPLPFYLGDDVAIDGSSLSPDGRHLLVVTKDKSYDEGKIGKLQRYVTESGYEEQEDERVRVGRNVPAPSKLWLLDLDAHEARELSLADLPGSHDDPLKKIRDENRSADEKRGKDKEKDAGRKDRKPSEAEVRAMTVADIVWSRDGGRVAIQLRAIDNKDRWIATVDFAKGKLVSQHRLTDPAWINWNFNDFGWTPDGRAMWYLSEESGYSQLYLKQPGSRAKALTSGQFEIAEPTLSADGRWFYVRANVEAPYSYDVFRVASTGGALQQVSRSGGGLDAFVLSADGSRLALLQSGPYLPAQLAVQDAAGGAARSLTDTRTPEYKALAWPKLDIVQVPSSHAARPIYAKFYKPADFDPAKKYPAVLFVHGAGYTQNVHLSYPYYFREQMFHNLLTEKGYLVLDMDYRASEGYGRDWRTAIYRQMGHPELEDLVDGVNWLVANQSVDSQRVGLYGGSYGGFMSLMAMFRAPEVFAAGAALRPVTDWTSYNHEYTSNILNTPQVDPIAYRRSSPIEFADGLKGGLLIAHGMIDDNVLYQDSVRLFQRLVELHKDDFELAGYPLERHGFVHPDSWYDEYRRILKLFETHLKP
ncbi:S9 family peptidase [Dokdonella immobilis]|uniref:Dipeptidyl aminopeptidase/acylaminoacyl peptidase n=1 Tax=Dokdonella immobilis TaxID=578942 RepID=A0A1I4VMT6_9GAMM|nr:S9 family peptidase [Dokdonella immobilis]SFN02562.1 Dipeptidyl aminopeptidase/acylaminoacyl peptidase [Dokdonella immobilis]